MKKITPKTKIPQVLKHFKAAYDSKDYEAIAGLFVEKAQFQGTAESEYRAVLPQDVAAYFKDIGDKRQSQEIELIALNAVNIHLGPGQIIGVEAIFHSAASDGTPNADKPIRIGMELNAKGEVIMFKSQPREESGPSPT